MNKQWNVKLNAKGLTAQQIIFNIMTNRGISDIKSFVFPGVENLLPLTSLHNIDTAAGIIKTTIEQKGKFFIYGDVDCDGCSATAIAYHYLRHFTDNVAVYVNQGKVHGIPDDFDVSQKLADVSTVIVLDSINDTPDKYIEILNAGINLIILDHHVPAENILEIKDQICLVSSAVDYPNPELSGAGVTWKMMKYLDSCFNTNYADDLMDLAAMGIIGDICSVGPQSMENRYICSCGFSNIHSNAIKTIVGRYEYTANTVSYSIAPLINSANRFEDNDKAIQLFISDDKLEILRLVGELSEYKQKQRDIVNDLYTRYIIPQSKPQANHKCLFFLLEDTKNFAGVVASKALEQFKRPVLVLTKSPDNTSYDGSMRAVGVADFRALIDNSGLATCKGHELSAGISIPAENVNLLSAYLENELKDITFTQEDDVDVELMPGQITSDLIKQLKLINCVSGKDFGVIKVKVSNVTDYQVTTMSSGKHLNLKLNSLSFIKWNCPDTQVPSDGRLSAVGTLDESFFGKTRTQQLIMEDYQIE